MPEAKDGQITLSPEEYGRLAHARDQVAAHEAGAAGKAEEARLVDSLVASAEPRPAQINEQVWREFLFERHKQGSSAPPVTAGDVMLLVERSRQGAAQPAYGLSARGGSRSSRILGF